MQKPIIAQIEILNSQHVDVEMVKRLDDMIYYAKQGKKAPEIANLLHIKNTQLVYHTLQFHNLSIAELRASEIQRIIDERPRWTQQQIADHLQITVDALRNHLHYKRGLKGEENGC